MMRAVRAGGQPPFPSICRRCHEGLSGAACTTSRGGHARCLLGGTFDRLHDGHKDLPCRPSSRVPLGSARDHGRYGPGQGPPDSADGRAHGGRWVALRDVGIWMEPSHVGRRFPRTEAPYCRCFGGQYETRTGERPSTKRLDAAGALDAIEVAQEERCRYQPFLDRHSKRKHGPHGCILDQRCMAHT